eukprot:6090929-Pleurochrysis_carterae.AAC.2
MMRAGRSVSRGQHHAIWIDHERIHVEFLLDDGNVCRLSRCAQRASTCRIRSIYWDERCRDDELRSRRWRNRLLKLLFLHCWPD